MKSQQTLSDRDLRIGRELACIRKAAGKTQQNVAEAVGVSVQQISKYELGKDSISASRYEQIVEYLEADLPRGFEEAQAVYHGPASATHPRVELADILRDFELCTDRFRSWLSANGGNREK